MQQLFQRREQTHMRLRVPRERCPPRPQCPLGRREVAGLAEEVARSQQHARSDAIARSRVIVAEPLHAMDERLVIVGSEIEAAGPLVGEVLQHHPDELLRKIEFLAPETQLLQLEHRVGEEHVVVKIGVEVRTALHVGREEPPVAPKPRADEIERSGRCGHELIVREGAPGYRHAADHERVPGGQDLLIARRAYTLRANAEELRAGSGEERLDFFLRAAGLPGDVGGGGGDAQVPAPLEVRFPVEPEAWRKHRELLGAQRFADLVAVPGVELPLVTFRVGIEARVVAALRGLHLAQRPVGDRAGHARVRGLRELAVGARWLRVEIREGRHERIVLLAQIFAVLAVMPGDPQQDVLEGRQAVAGFLREVGAAEERPLVVVRQEHGERPAAAALGEHLLRHLVDAVDVGTLLAVDFDVDEVLVEKARGGLVFEALFPQSVAPMTRVVSYTQVNRLFFGACPLERFAAPRVPLDWIVCMLPQVWARLSREMVRVLRRAVAVEVADFHPDLQSRLYTRPCPSSVPDSCRTPLPPTSSPLRASCASSAAKSGASPRGTCGCSATRSTPPARRSRPSMSARWRSCALRAMRSSATCASIRTRSSARASCPATRLSRWTARSSSGGSRPRSSCASSSAARSTAAGCSASRTCCRGSCSIVTATSSSARSRPPAWRRSSTRSRRRYGASRARGVFSGRTTPPRASSSICRSSPKPPSATCRPKSRSWKRGSGSRRRSPPGRRPAGSTTRAPIGRASRAISARGPGCSMCARMSAPGRSRRCGMARLGRSASMPRRRRSSSHGATPGATVSRSRCCTPTPSMP